MQSKSIFSRLYIIETQSGVVYMNKEIIKLIDKFKIELQITKCSNNSVNSYCSIVGNFYYWLKDGYNDLSSGKW